MIAALALVCVSCAPPAVPLAAACEATDGDTLRCGEERIRLLGIDAPELPGHCRRGRTCVKGDGAASRAALVAALHLGRLSARRVGRDRYGRTLAAVDASGTDLSCAQLASGQAVYVRAWDDRGLVRASCPELAR